VLPTISRGIQTRMRSEWRLRSEGEATSESMPSRLQVREALLGKRPRFSPLDIGPMDSTPQPIRSTTLTKHGLQHLFGLQSWLRTTSVSVCFWVEPERLLSPDPFHSFLCCVSLLSFLPLLVVLLSLYFFVPGTNELKERLVDGMSSSEAVSTPITRFSTPTAPVTQRT
jgi:hypothetical protein